MALYYQATSHTRCAGEHLHLFTMTFAKGAASAALQPAFPGNGLVDQGGKRDSHFERAREQGFLNAFIKETRVRFYASKHSAPEGWQKPALISPQARLLWNRFCTQVKYKDNGPHPPKPANEQVFMLARRIWTSIYPRPGRQDCVGMPIDLEMRV
jgi:hypothetical protein